MAPDGNPLELTRADLAPFRLRVSAAIVRDGRVLLIACDEPGYGPHYNLPGGGVDEGERLREALLREVYEETAARVTVGPLLLVSEHQVVHPHDASRMRLSVHLLFLCTLVTGELPRLPPNPDTFQIGVEWMAIANLPSVRLLPNFGNRIESALEQCVDCYCSEH